MVYVVVIYFVNHPFSFYCYQLRTPKMRGYGNMYFCSFCLYISLCPPSYSQMCMYVYVYASSVCCYRIMEQPVQSQHPHHHHHHHHHTHRTMRRVMAYERTQLARVRYRLIVADHRDNDNTSIGGNNNSTTSKQRRRAPPMPPTLLHMLLVRVPDAISTMIITSYCHMVDIVSFALTSTSMRRYIQLRLQHSSASGIHRNLSMERLTVTSFSLCKWINGLHTLTIGEQREGAMHYLAYMQEQVYNNH